MNKDFFSAFKQRPAGTSVRGLIDDSGVLQTDPDTVLAISSVYFASLFSADPLSDEVRIARDMVWSHVQPMVSPDMGAALLSPFTESELQTAVSALDASSCPGDDGLTRQFFTEFWDALHVTLLQGLQQIFDSGCMPPSLCSGLIALIPKGGVSTSLRQWRPITLLSSVYKILGRMISARLRPFMPDLIHFSPTFGHYSSRFRESI